MQPDRKTKLKGKLKEKQKKNIKGGSEEQVYSLCSLPGMCFYTDWLSKEDSKNREGDILKQ